MPEHPYHLVFDFQTNTETSIPFTQEELDELAEWEAARPAELLESLRLQRNERLAETDWWANSDVTMTDEQRAYRQALRDLPANTTDPANPVWPTKP